MRIGIISDIHSNLEALNAVLHFAASQRIDEYVCLGDIVGYGANPNECIDIIKNLTNKIVAGNHDFGVCGFTSISNFNDVAKAAIEWTKKIIRKDNLEFLKSLPLRLEFKKTLFVHSTPSHPDQWNYIFNMHDALLEFDFFSNQVCFVGHSHQPVVFSINSTHEIGTSIEDTISLSNKKRYIINAGSVGQPRDGCPKSSFLVYDYKNKKITFSRIEYNLKKAQEKIIDAGLPPFLAERLSLGR